MLLRTPSASFKSLAAWQEVVCAYFVPLEVQPESLRGFSNRAATDRMGSVDVMELCTSAQRVRRTQALASQSEHALYKVTLQISGSSQIEQDNRSGILRAGEWGIYDTTRPYEVSVQDQSHFLVLQFEEERLLPWLPWLSDAVARSFSATTGPARIAMDMLRLGLQERGHLSPSALSELSQTVIRMMALSLADGRPVPTESALDEVRRGQLLQIQQYVQDHLGDTGLNAQSLALQFRISRRYLYKLFELSGQAPADYIMAARLERACQLLVDGKPGRQISELAWQMGFSDAAVFSHAFRRRYGVSPSEWRRSRICGD
ncbi:MULTISPECIES: AraC-like ligand-binding domain-containing protein [Alcaligenes]|uniref:Helix-turn-helix domain-containing protein n=1 Tax=Alcaligenes parafaecalis TaxID=171260 RepID=A0ABT3VP98_9BURK|nr:MULTISPECIES: helix-turn-helix domain-containing protein [Alcaligenes]MCX5465362.1 helix-turn-helix domain-containing protein [Alcaligenes parafaecalis]QTB99331.1 helix-turn-helix domain-containing protein [Alcaligenes sp. SORT26]